MRAETDKPRYGLVEFFHYDCYGQALSKIERGHERDLNDVAAMIEDGLVRKSRLHQLYEQFEAQPIRYAAIDAGESQKRVLSITSS